MHPTRIFATPEQMGKAFEDYKDDLRSQSYEWKKVQYVGKDGDRVEEPMKVPMTIEGFKRYCRTTHGDISAYLKNADNLYNDFIPICSHIKEEIRENQILGGMLGFYNPSITQRLNGLVEKQEMAIKEQPLFPDEPTKD